LADGGDCIVALASTTTSKSRRNLVDRAEDRVSRKEDRATVSRCRSRPCPQNESRNSSIVPRQAVFLRLDEEYCYKGAKSFSCHELKICPELLSPVNSKAPAHYHIRRRLLSMICIVSICNRTISNSIFPDRFGRYCCCLNASKCLSITMFESNNRFTQFVIQLSSLPASFPDAIDPVMHFLKHISVNSWICF